MLSDNAISCLALAYLVISFHFPIVFNFCAIFTSFLLDLIPSDFIILRQTILRRKNERPRSVCLPEYYLLLMYAETPHLASSLLTTFFWYMKLISSSVVLCLVIHLLWCWYCSAVYFDRITANFSLQSRLYIIYESIFVRRNYLPLYCYIVFVSRSNGNECCYWWSVVFILTRFLRFSMIAVIYMQNIPLWSELSIDLLFYIVYVWTFNGNDIIIDLLYTFRWDCCDFLYDRCYIYEKCSSVIAIVHWSFVLYSLCVEIQWQWYSNCSAVYFNQITAVFSIRIFTIYMRMFICDFIFNCLLVFFLIAYISTLTLLLLWCVLRSDCRNFLLGRHCIHENLSQGPIARWRWFSAANVGGCTRTDQL